MNDQAHQARPRRRGQRFARLLTVLVFFAATSAGLHAMSERYGWREGRHWGHPTSGWMAGCDDRLPSASTGTGAPKL